MKLTVRISLLLAMTWLFGCAAYSVDIEDGNEPGYKVWKLSYYPASNTGYHHSKEMRWVRMEEPNHTIDVALEVRISREVGFLNVGTESLTELWIDGEMPHHISSDEEPKYRWVEVLDQNSSTNPMDKFGDKVAYNMALTKGESPDDHPEWKQAFRSISHEQIMCGVLDEDVTKMLKASDVKIVLKGKAGEEELIFSEKFLEATRRFFAEAH